MTNEENQTETPAPARDELPELLVRTQDRLDEMEGQPKYGIALFLIGSMSLLFSFLMLLMAAVVGVVALVIGEVDLGRGLAVILAAAAAQGGIGLGVVRHHRRLLEELRQVEHRLGRLLAGTVEGTALQASDALAPMPLGEYVARNMRKIRGRFGQGDWVDDLTTYGPGAAAGAIVSLFFSDDILLISSVVVAVAFATVAYQKWKKKRWDEEAPAVEEPPDDEVGRGS